LTVRHETSDEVLAEESRRGSTGAFAALYDRYARTVYNLARRVVHDADEAREITQTVFLQAYRGLDGFDSGARFYSWLYRIAINESLDAAARLARRAPGPAGREVTTEALAERLPAGGDSPTARIEREQTRERVRRAILRLTPDQRAVIALRHYLGQDYREMGRVLDLPEKTVKSRLFSARRTLRDLLEESS
jgi:RNA polymerase sigma-70 factor (ECF subfamily)